ncbi:MULTISPECIES: NAD(P)/FAD-dependent oxidoreductase [unclassified Mycolicibacterium]|uniref:phytoene desaturase family protein n=1 Tax=unclassified Mycolicibacterium TaxID=2636767 RepID=UPI0013067675|nr:MULTISPECIES: NAD(P)/FAD-dependent oxidoreductase [unclassified Mycolicibacterium]MUL85865.1 NAD(P)/FAD-dependent oxidoreductase [Mycolicibacterium sp. CBMA 329]MUL90235.1 NAD(P)/FAD-dependent oxidoreductase [Mycolicibacterium sp. CBMA 331]MUM01004.1 NAD(P)/FAD-dependent oxidoreductase [Mycolicibacterium sp. CBMA 334]MUM29862.1 NAD(P)/FAD-dependent oxidoreductase [Mycolicibacterium sp. CBMA 295]MUM39750.1 NAD(P)/FAD-dependent oxidoreductase [Mycolicibacterium sp. CBMA 247]
MTERALDAVIVGGGHNGLVAAAYLARAGRRVQVLERLDHVGGAAVSAHAFDGVDARLSRYSYLVSLLPRRIITDLGARIRLSRRRYSSYTPNPATGGATGLLVGPQPTFDAIGADADAAGFDDFYRRCGLITTRIWPTLLQPLRSRAEMRRDVLSGHDTETAAAWDALIERPIGEAITAAVSHDLVRGVMATDALIGTFAGIDDPSLIQNVCFLYHLIGGGTGDWDVPVGGMGAVSGALAAAAAGFGAEIITGAEVYAIDPDGEVRYRHGGSARRVRAEHVLANVTPAVLAELLGESAPETAPGAQVKVNLMLRRLPRLRDARVTPEQAFGGTFHINETFSQLAGAYETAAAGRVPDPLPCEIYCHSLTDPSILSEDLRASGAQTLTVFGLHTPHSLAVGDPDRMRDRLTSAVLNSLNSVLAEPIQDVLMEDSAGRLCIESKTTADLEQALGMTAGNIFHGALRWPFVEDGAPRDTAAQRWGVATDHDRILLCGSGSVRGGAVSGIGGHNAAMAVLEG